MSRYVDAEYVKAVMLNDRLMQGNAEFTLYVLQVETQVKALPGIDIVRCSECKHWRTYETWSECELWTDDPYESAKTKADDFCSYGSRSEKPNNCEPQTIRCPKCGRTDYIRDMEKDMGIKGSHYKYKCINCNTYIKDEPQTEYEIASEQREHDILYEPTYGLGDGSM